MANLELESFYTSNSGHALKRVQGKVLGRWPLTQGHR